MAKDEYGYDSDEDYTLTDNPWNDGTPFEHPAYSRGMDHSADSIGREILKWLKEPVKEITGFMFEPFQEIRQLIYNLRTKNE